MSDTLFCNTAQRALHYTHWHLILQHSTEGITVTHSNTLFCISTVGITFHTLTPCSATQHSGHYVYRQWHFVLQHSVAGVMHACMSWVISRLEKNHSCMSTDCHLVTVRGLLTLYLVLGSALSVDPLFWEVHNGGWMDSVWQNMYWGAQSFLQLDQTLTAGQVHHFTHLVWPEGLFEVGVLEEARDG